MSEMKKVELEVLGSGEWTVANHESGLITREFQAIPEVVEGRTVDIRLVPFGEVARVADPPNFVPYDEEWMPGAFDHQLNAPNRIHARYGHSTDIANVVGHGIALRSVPGDGYHLSVKIHQTPAGDTALELLRDGALPGVSLEARPVKSVRSIGGIVQRMKANLRGFAFCQVGAFSGARVLAIREQQEFTLDEELLPIPMEDGLVHLIERAGLQVPDGLKAHPVTDTPAEADTSEDGTRRDVNNESTEE